MKGKYKLEKDKTISSSFLVVSKNNCKKNKDGLKKCRRKKREKEKKRRKVEIRKKKEKEKSKKE